MRRAWLVATLAMSGLPALAHHSGAEYDHSQTTTLSGTVATMEWANPHSRLYLQTPDGNGTSTRWQIDLPSVNRLVRLGWTRHAVNPGDKVTVTCAPMRGTAHVAWAVTVLDSAGKRLFVDAPAGSAK